jgi:hypothetical protein
MRVGTELFIARDFTDRLMSGEVDFEIDPLLNEIAPGTTAFVADVGDGYSIHITRTEVFDSASVVLTLKGGWDDRPSSPNSVTILSAAEKVGAISNQRGVVASIVELSGHSEAVFLALIEAVQASDGSPFMFDASNALECSLPAPSRAI